MVERGRQSETEISAIGKAHDSHEGVGEKGVGREGYAKGRENVVRTGK